MILEINGQERDVACLTTGIIGYGDIAKAAGLEGRCVRMVYDRAVGPHGVMISGVLFPTGNIRALERITKLTVTEAAWA